MMVKDRLIQCVVCGCIELDEHFLTYTVFPDQPTYGTCRNCYRDIPFQEYQPSLFPFWSEELISCYGDDYDEYF